VSGHLSNNDLPDILVDRLSADGRFRVCIERGDVGLFDKYEHEWLRLWEAEHRRDPAYHPNLLRLLAANFFDRAVIYLFTVWSAGRLRAVLPLCATGGSCFGIRLQSLSNPHSSRFDLLTDEGMDDDILADLFRVAMDAFPGWRQVVISPAPADGRMVKVLGRLSKQTGHIGFWESRCMPYFSLSEGEDVFPVDASAKFRANIRRRQRKLEQEKGVPLMLKRTEKFDENTWQRFLALEHSGWKGKRGSAILSDDRATRFYTDWARLAADLRQLNLYELYAGDTPIAVHFGLVDRGCYYVPKLAYREDYKEYGPGQLIVAQILRDLKSRGVREFDFLGPKMDWKMEWTSRCRVHGRYYWYCPNAVGSTAYYFRFGVVKYLLWAKSTLKTWWSKTTLAVYGGASHDNFWITSLMEIL
jgi:hypothetical protein